MHTRKEFLKLLTLGLLSAPMVLMEACGGRIRRQSNVAINDKSVNGSGCPNETTPHVNQGPYYFDSQMNRSDIREDRKGVPITYLFTVLDANCNPVKGAVVDIWQTDREGVYSAFQSQGTSGETYLRGFQYTDEEGKCTFKSIFPGWYPGRITHVHGKVFLNGSQKDTTNFFFPKDIETEVYNSPLYVDRGQNKTSIERDAELRGDVEAYNALLMEVSGSMEGGLKASYVLKY